MSVSLQPVRVLHVDDEPDLSTLVATHLERESHYLDVISATSPRLALDEIATRDVDCVVSAYKMAGTNGIELRDAVRDRQPTLPFLLFTHRDREKIDDDVLAEDQTAYLQKSREQATYAELAATIEALVGRARDYSSDCNCLLIRSHAVVRSSEG